MNHTPQLVFTSPVSGLLWRQSYCRQDQGWVKGSLYSTGERLSLQHGQKALPTATWAGCPVLSTYHSRMNLDASFQYGLSKGNPQKKEVKARTMRKKSTKTISFFLKKGTH